MKAPSAIDTPTDCISSEMAITSSRAKAVKISRASVLAMKRSSGRTRKRPPITRPASTTITLTTAIQALPPPPALSGMPSSGTMAIIGIAAMSWNSRIEKLAWPAGVGIRLRSSSEASAIAVEDSDSPRPAISAIFQPTPASRAAPNRTAATSPTWAPPQPKMGRRSAHRRLGSSSRPIRNSSSTTPNSAKCSASSASAISLKPNGPIRMPATR
jgi:hypothetical protein